jgi:3-hydroxyisobutyrate dehydrogenase-like beta-hydroxyacid dehydrogenase
MSDTTIGLLHPGEMGAAVGQCLVSAGHTVLWVAAGRGAATRERAAAAGLDECGWAEMAARSDVILSVCPPGAAIAPATAGEVAAIVKPTSFVDGGIIGTTPVKPGFIRLYLSGDRAGEVRELFGGTAVDARLVAPPGTASAVKMAYASWTKGSAALLLAARALARAEGVEPVLLEEWGISQPGLERRSAAATGSAAAKGWRWVAEMEEIAATMAAAGLPEGFHQAAAEIYRGFSVLATGGAPGPPLADAEALG